MRFRTLASMGLALVSAGCASGFRVGGDRFGVGASASVGPPPTTVAVPVPVTAVGPPVLPPVEPPPSPR